MKPLKQIEKDIKEIYLIITELTELEDYENTDYSGIVTEISWNKEMLKNRLITLKERAEMKGGQQH